MITSQQLESITDYVTTYGPSEETLLALRQQFSDIHFTYCLDDDVMAPVPVVEQKHFNLYMIDSSNHCLSFTPDAELASGLVIAEITDDEP